MGLSAVFVDKDGTLVEDVPYNVDPRRIRLLPGAAEGLRMLQRAGFVLFVVSNQSGAARAYFRPEALTGVERQIRHLLDREGVRLEGFAWCPHHPEGAVAELAVRCDCRKPEPGLLRAAAGRHGIDLRRSWMVGDILDDVEAGHRAGCKAVLIAPGGETEWVVNPIRMPDWIARDLTMAARGILRGGRAFSEPMAVAGGGERPDELRARG
jgi:D-glycero-D-manno-heptose 1,7-bisphosphate phosphatase